MKLRNLFVSILFIIITLLFSNGVTIYANDKEQGLIEEVVEIPITIFDDNNLGKGEYNELGVEIGTEVYGEDISELSEEELQYVPKGWRDGVDENEHESTNLIQSRFSIMRVSYPDVNSYINNLSVAKTEYDYKSVFERFNYRNGFGAVEGVVAHETANDKSTINSEIAYMTRNHENAFVHAFVDDQRIIEIHPLDYGAWGAGRQANKRFVHVELVRVNNFDAFARSINNYADYISNVLYNYDLGVTSAEASGKGSLWSHKAVSIHLGATTHVDPHGYFAKYGYNWNDFVNLVKSKYDDIEPIISNTSKLGHLRSENAKIYKRLADNDSSIVANSIYTNVVYYIKSEAKVNGQNYYLISEEPSSKQGIVGWVKAQDMNTHAHVGVDKKSKTYYLKGTGIAYDKAWGGSKDIAYKTLSSYKDQAFYIDLTEKVGNNTWYRGDLNGKKVWIHSNYLTTKIESKTSKLGHFKTSNVDIYNNLEDKDVVIKSGNKYSNAVYYIKKKARINEQIYYLISEQPSSSAGVLGWVKASEMNTHNHDGVDKDKKSYYIKGTGIAYSKAWGGSKDVVYKDLVSYEETIFNIDLTEKVGNNIWYRGNLNGKTVWIHSSYLIEKKELNTSKLGHFKNSSVKVYKDFSDNTSHETINDEYTNKVYYIKKEAKIGNQVYYLMSKQPNYKNSLVGWVKAEDVASHSHLGVDNTQKTYYLKGTGIAYSKAWGGSKDAVYKDLSTYKGAIFTVNLTEKVGNNTWYRGKLNGQTVWIHSSYLTLNSLVEEKITSKLGHIKSPNIVIYKEPGNNASVTTANSEYTNKVYYIKKEVRLNSQSFYLISEQPSSVSGIVGWVKAKDMSTHTHLGIDKENKKLKIKGTGKAYSKAWGGSKDIVYQSLSNYEEQTFNVNLTESVGNNTWYRGTLNGKIIWIHSAFVI
ncbi:GW dipeptide domain-containing protein [Paraliobacillus sediminis]|uniref:GW dipeptide domain-containing protein n=1 Tax=Paraliobacillus sediminis TaxID=1885916 RepID=UPI000E3EB1C8|nr:N-acetylmuramoyl-L-alanine amidase [Paraliobacillus sediminis]